MTARNVKPQVMYYVYIVSKDDLFDFHSQWDTREKAFMEASRLSRLPGTKLARVCEVAEYNLCDYTKGASGPPSYRPTE